MGGAGTRGRSGRPFGESRRGSGGPGRRSAALGWRSPRSWLLRLVRESALLQFPRLQDSLLCAASARPPASGWWWGGGEGGESCLKQELFF